MAVEQRSGEASARPLSEKEHRAPRLDAEECLVRARAKAAGTTHAAHAG